MNDENRAKMLMAAMQKVSSYAKDVRQGQIEMERRVSLMPEIAGKTWLTDDEIAAFNAKVKAHNELARAAHAAKEEYK